MDRARHRADARLTRAIGLFGGSFNPAHRGHRRASLGAIDALCLDQLWWLVSPGNPLKDGARDMAPYAARLASARAMAKRSPIRATDIERRLGLRFTVDTVAAIVRRHPRHRFIWVMGADNIAQFHRWRHWRRLARMVPIAVVVRPGYEVWTAAGPAAAWLRRHVRGEAGACQWTAWRPPAIVLLHVAPDPTSATAIRAADPDWHRRYLPAPPLS